MNTGLSLARAVADAVLYEGYLLYPYRASSQKNQSRWQFGILGPPGAAAAGQGEDSEMFADILLQRTPCDAGGSAKVPPVEPSMTVHLRFLHLQSRTAEAFNADTFTAVDELTIGSSRWLSWDEATECDVPLGPFPVSSVQEGLHLPVDIPEVEDVEELRDDTGRVSGRLVRRRRALHGEVHLVATALDRRLMRIRVTARNAFLGATTSKQDAIATSFIGAHLLLTAENADFLSVVDPPEERQAAAASCDQYRFWPVLAGPEGQSDVLMLSPIILYDHPTLAPQSSVALYDSTEIDEILTLRILTLTEEEKAEARSTDPRAAAIIDRCEAMTPEQMQQLHGVLLNPHAMDEVDVMTPDTRAPDTRAPDTIAPDTLAPDIPSADLPWWTPEADNSVQPDVDVVMIDGVPVSRGARVRVVPRRRADAQDVFFADQVARVTSVHFDVDGSTHVGLLLEDDPAADLYDGYGRSFYFAPDELQPLDAAEPAGPLATTHDRKDTQS